MALWPAQVSALTSTDLYVLGKHSVKPLANNKDLVLVDTIALGDLKVSHSHHGIATDVTFTDVKTGQAVAAECKPLGSGMGDFLKVLQSDEVPVEG